MPKSYLLGSTLLLLLLTGLLWFWHPHNSEKPSYISSSQCQQCHSSHYEGWQDSLHSKIFQPATAQNILADFSRKDSALTFTKQDIDYVLGGYWEQVYVKMIDNEYYPLPAKWLVAEQRWEPYKVDIWQDSPMSKECNPCHVTGLIGNTAEFNEFSIGCEACHGPGSVHVNNRKMAGSATCTICHWKARPIEDDIVHSVSATVCGQCHNRKINQPDSALLQAPSNINGNLSPEPETAQNAPAASADTAASTQESAYWWGQGVAKKRHQEFAEWGKSNHSQSLKKMHDHYSQEKGPLSTECLNCHATDYILCRGAKKPDLHSARYGITCVACHNPHGNYNSSPTQQRSTSCLICHKTDHPSCPSPTLQPHFPCPGDTVHCEDCHMPYTVKNAGAFSIRSHGFQIISPAETRKNNIPNSCQNGSCHQDKTLDWAEDQFNIFYPDFSGAAK